MANYFGYMRISTKEERGKQKFSRQEKALETYAKDNNIEFVYLFKDDASGKSFMRDEWKKLEKLVHEGDTVVFKDITRFTRERDNGFKKYMELVDRGVNLVFIDNPTLNTEYIQSMQGTADRMKEENIVGGMTLEFVIKLLIVTELDRAEKERLSISKRIKDGIKASEKTSGRKEGQIIKLSDDLKADIVLYLADRSIKAVDIMKKHNISRNTFKKYCQIVKEEM